VGQWRAKAEEDELRGAGQDTRQERTRLLERRALPCGAVLLGFVSPVRSGQLPEPQGLTLLLDGPILVSPLHSIAPTPEQLFRTKHHGYDIHHIALRHPPASGPQQR
jgi:hypothetical protein